MPAATNPAFAMLRALRLLDPVLACLEDGPSTPESRWLPKALLGTGLVDEERTANDLCVALRRQDHDPIEGLFRLADEIVHVKFGIPHCADIDVFHQVGYEIDTDLLVAARLVLLHDKPFQKRDWVRALSWPSVLGTEGFALQNVVSREIVDTHVHLGGALPGSFYWIAAMAGYARLYRTQGWCPEDPERWISAITASQQSRADLFRCLRTGKWAPGEEAEQNFFARPWSRSPEEPFCDYVLHWLLPDDESRGKQNPILGERFILWAALWCCRWKAPWPGRQAFLGYIRRRSSFIRHLSHGPGARGLERFQTTFRRQHLLFDDRVAAARRDGRRERRLRAQILGLERFRVRHALRYQFSDPTDAPWARDQGAGLEPGIIPSTPWRPPRQVELRVTPVLGSSQMRVFRAYLEGLRDFVVHERDAPPLRVGFVFHVHRHAAAHARSSAMWQFKGLLAMLHDEPALRPFIVGIDAAGAEMAAAPRDLAECFAMVRLHDRLQGSRPGDPPIRLGLTCHAGEDFRDLLTGLRYVDDAVSLLGLRAGDRIGHGIAVALSPPEWYSCRAITYPLLSDHVIDLLWGRFLARRTKPAEKLSPDTALDNQLAVRLENVLFEARGKRKALPGLDARIEDMLRAFDDTGFLPTEGHILSYLGVNDSNRPFPLQADPMWIDVVTRLRTRVIARLTHADVVIETCPTSNLLVGGFQSYQRLPYLNLNHAHLPGAPPDDPQLPLSINSDDPGIFRTTVANEYRLLGNALMRLGHRSRVVGEWLEEARRVSVESTFIPRWSPPTRQELLHWLSVRIFREHCVSGNPRQ